MKRISFLLLLCLAGTLCACKKYLDAKPDKKLAVPQNLQDLQALLDNYFYLNYLDASAGVIASDEYYLTSNDWASLTNIDDQQNYLWDKEATYYNNWSGPYQMVFYANVVLDNIHSVGYDSQTQADWNRIKGTALFFRANAFYQLATLYAKPYDAATAGKDLGIPLRLTANVDEPSVRSSVQQTYDHMVQDLQEAATLLPAAITYKTRPSKPAAWALLARVLLAKEDYPQAGLYADSCLQLYDSLMDYNQLSASATNPISLFNSEVLYHSRLSGGGPLTPARCKVDSNLYRSYAPADLRRTVLFKSNGDGSYAFKGDYGNNNSSQRFTGLATDEMYLIRAECFARAGKVPEAMSNLNTLLKKRWKQGSFQPFSAVDAIAALDIILQERKKELLFRAQRWPDLRRLNKDARFAVTLKRVVNGQTYLLPPNDVRYTLLIPAQVIATSGIQQNER